MKKIAILHIITTLELGGAQKNALDIIKSLDPEKYSRFFISAPQGLLQDECSQIPGVRFYFIKQLRREISFLSDITSLFLIFNFILANRIDIVHTHSSKAGIIGRWAAFFARVPLIVHTVHGWSFNDYQHKAEKGLYVLLEKITSRITSVLVAVSKNDIEKGISLGIGDKDKYRLISCGISLNEIDQAKKNAYTPEEAGISAPLRVGMIACLKPQKNPLDFIRLAENICAVRQDTDFVLIGEGEKRPELEQALKSKGLSARVKLLGWRRDVLRILPLFDVVVLTSLWEGLPVAVLEAMANAKPVVAYDAGGISEIVCSEETGYLINPGDIAALTEKVNFLLNNKPLRLSMGEKARACVEQPLFDKREMISALEELYYGG